MTAGQTDQTVLGPNTLISMHLSGDLISYQVGIGHCEKIIQHNEHIQLARWSPQSSATVVVSPPVFLCQHLRTLFSVALKNDLKLLVWTVGSNIPPLRRHGSFKTYRMVWKASSTSWQAQGNVSVKTKSRLSEPSCTSTQRDRTRI